MNNNSAFKDREINLLKLLHKNAPKPVSRPTLLEKIWGWSFFPETNVTDVAIYRLRRKLEPFEELRFVTSFNKGYRLDMDSEILDIEAYLRSHESQRLPSKKVQHKRTKSKPIVSTTQRPRVSSCLDT